jgi:hypothetical protein
MAEPAQDLNPHFTGQPHRKATIFLNPLPHRETINELRNHVVGAVWQGREVVDDSDIRMLQLCRKPRLAKEPTPMPLIGKEARPHDLDRSDRVQVKVANLENLAHPTGPELTEDLVLAVQNAARRHLRSRRRQGGAADRTVLERRSVKRAAMRARYEPWSRAPAGTGARAGPTRAASGARHGRVTGAARACRGPRSVRRLSSIVVAAFQRETSFDRIECSSIVLWRFSQIISAAAGRRRSGASPGILQRHRVSMAGPREVESACRPKGGAPGSSRLPKKGVERVNAGSSRRTLLQWVCLRWSRRERRGVGCKEPRRRRCHCASRAGKARSSESSGDRTTDGPAPLSAAAGAQRPAAERV